MQCTECKKPYDFETQVSGSCSTCNKKNMCETCCYSHECIEGKRKQLIIITNPKWICNLVKNMKN